MWSYFIGFLTKKELLEHRNSSIFTVDSYIRQGLVNVHQWKEYCDKMDLKYGQIDKKIRFNWLPNFCSYMIRIAVKERNRRRGPQQKLIEIKEILPCKFATIVELLFWGDEILKIDQKYMDALNKYKRNGVISVSHIHGLTLSHLWHFAKPKYV